MRISPEALFILLFRKMDEHQTPNGSAYMLKAQPSPRTGSKEYDEGLALEMENRIDGHPEKSITPESLCNRFNLSVTSLKRLLRQRTDGFSQYLTNKRHEATKRLIRDGRVGTKPSRRSADMALCTISPEDSRNWRA